MKTIDAVKLNELFETAKTNPRKRINFNLHEQLDDPIQRLCITGEKCTVFPAHRHLGKWELMILLKGSLTSYVYNDDGTVREKYELKADGTGISAIELDEGVWHNCVFHEDGTTFLEVKRGPYQPLSEAEKAPFPGVQPDA